MSDSFLSFTSSASFRNSLIARNLAPYSVQGTFSPQVSNINYETNLTVSNVLDSPNNLVSTNTQANGLYPLNEYGPDGGFGQPINLAGPPLPVDSNKGPYDPNDTVIDLVNEFFIDAAYIQNTYGPQGGFNNFVIITDIVKPGKIYQPYWEPPTFAPSSYSPYDILISNNPTGSNGSLSQDSYIIQLGSSVLKDLLLQNQSFYTQQNLQNQNSINFGITVDDVNDNYLSRLDGSYVPFSPIPGDYFLDGTTNRTTDTLGEAINLIAGRSTLFGGALNGGLTRAVNQSQLFLENTNDGQKGIMFANISKNIYRPAYGGSLLAGIGTNLLTTGINSLIDGFGLQLPGAYYVGSALSEPAYLESPIDAVPTDVFGRDTQAIVFGPDVLGKEYEKNQEKINFGLKAKSYTNSGSIDGEFIWTSPKYKDNAGFYVSPGGAPTTLDNEFNIVEANYNKNLSTNIDFKPGSILDDTQRLINSADSLQGEARLKHVGNAINQVSKVFNDGYKEITKGSQVLSYKDQTDGTEAGIEYCRIFQKDTPYFTYADLQKTDGITTAGRKFSYSVFDNTYNLNIVPMKGVDSTNIINSRVKKYMFSIENLAWRTSDRPGYTYDELPDCEKGPNGGRIMWFPPYDLTFSDNSKPDFNGTSFLGRPEPIYTYKNTSRSGSLKWKIIVDSPASLNTIIEKQLVNTPKERLDSIMDSFFAGCVKYDIYELGIKFNKIPTRDLFVYQEILNNPRLTEEELSEVLKEVPVENTTIGGPESPIQETNQGGNNNSEATNTFEDPFKKLEGFGFYFPNEVPGPVGSTTAPQDFDTYFTDYQNVNYNQTLTNAPQKVLVGDKPFLKDTIPTFWNQVISGNYDKLKKEFLDAMEDVIIKRNGVVNITLEGTSSAAGSESSNFGLSERRIDSVKKWIEKQTFSDGTTYKSKIPSKITFKEIPLGEKVIIPKSETTFDEINCNIIPLDASTNTETENSKINSLPAMACRRVILKTIKADFPPTPPTPPGEQEIKEPLPPTVQQTVEPVPSKPIPQVDVQQKIKDGISKKVLRQLFSECDYFQVIKETNPMIYDSLKEKIKYFSPAFHSMTPEGLNSRLTFLNQCTRPGQTIPVIGPDGRPKYNDALNTSFGAPPILVLRVGDFYHSKIVPTSLDISYEPLLYDLNPEGIGIQPMIANITMAFNIIGGMGLKEPIDQLQNALSFNYYANTEIYDERATATEDTSARDKYVVEKILNAQQPVKSNTIDNQIPVKGGDTIGSVLTTNLADNGNIQSGEIEYTSLFKELSDNTNKHFKTINNQLRTIQNTSNYGMLQLVGFKRKYSEGDLLFYSTNKFPVKIYGKPEDVENRVESLVNNVVGDIKDDMDPIMSKLIKVPNIPKSAFRQVRDKLKSLTQSKINTLNQIVVEPINEITKSQENYIQTFKKVDAVLYSTSGTTKSGVDGKKLETGDVKVFDLTEITGTSVFNGMFDQYQNKVGNSLIKFDELLISKNISNKENYLEEETSFVPITNKLIIDENCRFYMVYADTFVNDEKYQTFFNELINLDLVKKNTILENELKKVLGDLKVLFKEEFDAEIKNFDDYEKSPEYQIYDKFELDAIDTKMSYTTDVTVDKMEKRSIMKSVYRTGNENFDDKFNKKVKFN
jgi:hypothetical protein